MAVFIALLFIPIIIQHVSIVGNRIEQKKYQAKNRWALTIFFLILTILVALRHESIGKDTENYIYFFKKFSGMDWSKLTGESMEIGFLYFNKAISLFSTDPQCFLAVSVVVTSILIYPTYRRLCEDASLTIVIFCTMSTFAMMFSGIRQMLAIGVGFIAYEFTRRKKLIPYALCVILAITIHTSAFMLIFMYPLYHARITKKWLYAIVPIMATVFVFNRPIFAVIAAFIERYTKYEGSIESTGAYTILILFALFVVFSFVVPDESLLDEETIGLRNFLLLSLMLQMFAPLHMLAMRMNYYYIIFVPLLIPKIIRCRSERWTQVAVFGRHVMVAFFIAYFIINANNGGLHIFPYHFLWEVP